MFARVELTDPIGNKWLTGADAVEHNLADAIKGHADGTNIADVITAVNTYKWLLDDLSKGSLDTLDSSLNVKAGKHAPARRKSTAASSGSGAKKLTEDEDAAVKAMAFIKKKKPDSKLKDSSTKVAGAGS